MYDASDPPNAALARPCDLVGPPEVLTLVDRLLSRPRQRGGFGWSVGRLGSIVGGVDASGMSAVPRLRRPC